ncbi:hypothetical protein FOZ76_14605 [Verticiella sediminum]|uniref:Uncharacterized protein n=1 Tax=Verticiella sediminum TaxID=1247510 RepID=A0A556AIC0_9BURK|nr:hypothetical protein [Verticiella sediminum]TSH92648.1 hypothetical protein FOZ76_14605 [Verticiella sediminum]
MSHRQRIQPTDEYLRRAHYEARVRASFDEAMRDPLLAHAISLHAIALMRRVSAPPTELRPPPPQDVKRLAAGDND